MVLHFFICIIDQLCCLHSIAFQSARFERSMSISHQNTAALGDEPKTEWWVEQTPQAAFMMSCDMSVGLSSSLLSNPVI